MYRVRVFWQTIGGFLALFTACLMATSPVFSQSHQNEAILVNPQFTNLYQKLGEIEKQVYGHDYTGQTISQRVVRLEQSLFGTRQLGSLEVRYQRIVGKMGEKTASEVANDQIMLIDYLEQKLFEQNYKELPLPSRVKRLEAHVFGKTFEQYPMDVRVKKLTYTMPIMAKGVKVSKPGVVIASTQHQTPKSTDLPSSVAATTQAPQTPLNTAIYSTTRGKVVASKRMTATGTPISIGDYALNIHRPSPQTMLRWPKLPVTVYVRKANLRQSELIQQALKLWNQRFQFEQVTQSVGADILIDCQNESGTNSGLKGSMTRPIIHLDEQKKIRTVVLINWTPYSLANLDDDQQLRALLHQLGHAAGIWGHSDDPNDIMYPLGSLEQSDIPALWLRRSPRPSAPANRYPVLSNPPQLSQRDFNTLIKVYEQPGTDLRTYSPY